MLLKIELKCMIIMHYAVNKFKLKKLARPPGFENLTFLCFQSRMRLSSFDNVLSLAKSGNRIVFDM